MNDFFVELVEDCPVEQLDETIVEAVTDSSSFDSFISDSLNAAESSTFCLGLVACYFVVLASRFVKYLVKSFLGGEVR